MFVGKNYKIELCKNNIFLISLAKRFPECWMFFNI